MKRTRVLATAGISLGLVVAMQTGCAQTKAATRPAAEKAEPATQPAAQPAQAPETVSLSGKVVESISGGSYHYVALEKDGKVSWAAMAVPATVGQEITLKPGVVMQNFTSKALNRTFDAIVFSNGPIGQEVKAHQGMGAAAAPAAPGTAQARKLAGKVVETMDAGGYTYLKLDNGGETAWAAIPTTKVSVGQEVELQPGMPMTNFTSKSLNRTFDNIAFSSGLATDAKAPAQSGAQGAPAGHPAGAGKPEASGAPAAKAGGMGAMAGHGAQMGKRDVTVAGKVVEATTSGAFTYLLIDQEGKQAWAAIPAGEVAVGQQVKLQPGNEMHGFTQKKLNKTFDSVVFSPGIAKQ